MDERTHTVALFFGLTPEGGGVSEDAVAAVESATKDTVRKVASQASVIKAILQHGVPATQWAAAASQVIALLHKELSDLSIPQLLAGGWTKYEKFQAYCDETKHPAHERNVIPLFTHTVSSTHRPTVELRIDGVPAGRVDFEVELSVTIESVSVVIMNKRFMAAQLGAVEAKGTVKCEGVDILERKLGRFDLPGTLSFGDGYPIEPSASAQLERETSAWPTLR
ncbi:MAG TPA: hypothetical protein VF461_10350 [Gemmatimonadaceae bacterium]